MSWMRGTKQGSAEQKRPASALWSLQHGVFTMARSIRTRGNRQHSCRRASHARAKGPSRSRSHKLASGCRRSAAIWSPAADGVCRSARGASCRDARKCGHGSPGVPGGRSGRLSCSGVTGSTHAGALASQAVACKYLSQKPARLYLCEPCNLNAVLGCQTRPHRYDPWRPGPPAEHRELGRAFPTTHSCGNNEGTARCHR